MLDLGAESNMVCPIWQSFYRLFGNFVLMEAASGQKPVRNIFRAANQRHCVAIIYQAPMAVAVAASGQLVLHAARQSRCAFPVTEGAI